MPLELESPVNLWRVSGNLDIQSILGDGNEMNMLKYHDYSDRRYFT